MARHTCPEPGCCKSYTRPYQLEAHLSSHRGIHQRHKCEQCSKSYVWPSDLQEHRRSKHGRFLTVKSKPAAIIRCPGCGTVYTSHRVLKRHNRSLTVQGCPRSKFYLAPETHADRSDSPRAAAAYKEASTSVCSNRGTSVASMMLAGSMPSFRADSSEDESANEQAVVTHVVSGSPAGGHRSDIVERMREDFLAHMLGRHEMEYLSSRPPTQPCTPSIQESHDARTIAVEDLGTERSVEGDRLAQRSLANEVSWAETSTSFTSTNVGSSEEDKSLSSLEEHEDHTDEFFDITTSAYVAPADPRLIQAVLSFEPPTPVHMRELIMLSTLQSFLTHGISGTFRGAGAVEKRRQARRRIFDQWSHVCNYLLTQVEQSLEPSDEQLAGLVVILGASYDARFYASLIGKQRDVASMHAACVRLLQSTTPVSQSVLRQNLTMLACGCYLTAHHYLPEWDDLGLEQRLDCDCCLHLTHHGGVRYQSKWDKALTRRYLQILDGPPGSSTEALATPSEQVSPKRDPLVPGGLDPDGSRVTALFFCAEGIK